MTTATAAQLVTSTPTATATSTASTLSAPTLVAEAGAGRITLTWGAVAKAVSYQLIIWDRPANKWRRLDEGDLTGTSYTHGGLTAGTTNYYAVRAVGADGAKSVWSNQPSATVGESSAVPEATEERAALVALYEATDGANWMRGDSWLSDDPIGTWYGVTTDSSGRVTALSLSRNKLNGPFPDLSALTELKHLALFANDLSGPIPDLSKLTKLDAPGPRRQRVGRANPGLEQTH